MMDGKIKPGRCGSVVGRRRRCWTHRDLARKAARAPMGGDASLTIWRGSMQQVISELKVRRGGAEHGLMSELAPRTVGMQLVSAPQGGVTYASVDPSGSAADSGNRERRHHPPGIQQQPVSDPDQAMRLSTGSFGRESVGMPFCFVSVTAIGPGFYRIPE